MHSQFSARGCHPPGCSSIRPMDWLRGRRDTPTAPLVGTGPDVNKGVQRAHSGPRPVTCAIAMRGSFSTGDRAPDECPGSYEVPSAVYQLNPSPGPASLWAVRHTGGGGTNTGGFNRSRRAHP
jgi:hypothetical protein